MRPISTDLWNDYAHEINRTLARRHRHYQARRALWFLLCCAAAIILGIMVGQLAAGCP
jgi:hypothetical protein